MTAKEYLSRYKSAYREAKDIELRMARLRLKYSSPAAIEYSDMPKAHDSEHDLSDYASQMDGLISLLIAQYSKCMGIETDILSRIDAMQNWEEKELLRYRYVDGLSWDSIIERMPFAPRTVYRIHGSALMNFPMPPEKLAVNGSKDL
jgi:hypothetical protein